VGVPFGQSSNNWFDFAFRTAGGTKPPPADTGSGNGSFRDVPGGVNNWKSTMMSVQTESGVPWEVLAAIMSIESGGNNANDPGGAMGLMQIMPKYWQQLANRFGGNLQDPYTNIRTAAEILKMNYEQYGSWEKAAAAYFGGGGAFNPDGSYSNSSDSYDTTITDYVERFNDYLYTLGYGRPTPGEVGSGGSPASSHAGAALDAAMTAQGVPYVWAGQNMSGFDCSGLMMWAYAQAGIQIPRTAAEQYAGTQRITGDDLQPGDLVFFSGTTDAPGVTHVGMYIGNGQFIQAPDVGDVVKISSLYDEFWFSHIYGYGRV
jgi:cell wall-associated NlpC family hydrolase